MNLKFKNKSITGILTVLPEKEVKFEDEMEHYNFSIAKSMKLKLAMGYNKHRVVDDGVCVSDLAVIGMEYLFGRNLLQKEEIDALVLLTQSPDHFMPPTSNIIQGRLNLKEDMLCIDINQGCAAFEIGLIQAFLLLEQESIRKVVLINADVLSRKVSKQDRNSNPLVGDGASITVIEETSEDSNIHGITKMDGKRADVLMIPAGGFRLPSSAKTAIMEEDKNGNFRAKDHLVMKGDEVFNFVQTAVPPMIMELLENAGCTKDNVDYFMFHQPNKFMLQKLADKMGVSYEKMPNNIVENFGNASGVTVPTAIAFNLGDKLLSHRYKTCLAGFGVGLTWSALLTDLGPLNFCEIIYF
jgi:3-oxoacyl-[acyl-carrier-protein] synthase III